MYNQNTIVNGHLQISVGTTSIGDDAFKENQLTHVTIPDSVTSIGNKAFYRNQLISVEIGNNTTSIGDGAFRHNQMTSVKIPVSVTSIGAGAFDNNKLTHVVIPYSVKKIGNHAFANNPLISVVVPSMAYYGQRDRIFVDNSESILFIVNGHLIIPYRTEHIADNAYQQFKLRSVEGLPFKYNNDNKEKARIFGTNFQSISYIVDRHLKISERTKHIDDFAYQRMYIRSVEIPDSVTSIGNGAFKSNELKHVTIPDSVTNIGDDAFAENKLKSVEITDKFNNDEEKARIFGPDFKSMIYVVNRHHTISKGTTNIGSEAYKKLNLTSVVIPESVTSIDYSAFYNNQLTSVEIPKYVTSIGSWAFYQNQLTSVVIPESVTSIGSWAFYENNQLKRVVIPESVTSIGDGAFENNQLTIVRIPARFNNDKERIFGSNFRSILNIVNGQVKIPHETTHIDTYASQKMQLTSVEIPQSVTSIGEYAFAENRLTSVEIPESVTSIGRGAFAGNKLTSVVIPAMFNNDVKKARIFGNDWTKINFTSRIDDFFRAVERRDDIAIEEIINQGININEKNSMGQTALIYASEKGLTQIVNILLKHNADTYLIDTKGKNALMYAVELNHTSFIASLVDKMEPTAREITYRERIKNLNPYFLAFLNSERPDFTIQLRAYINSNHDYLKNINDFVSSNCNARDNTLIIDFDNIAYNTIERQSSSLYTLPTNRNRTTTSLLPNVTDNEMISYKSAVLLVLRYAKENQFTNVIAITKNPQFLTQFKHEYNELKTNGKITITQKKNGTFINSVFNDMDLQRYLSLTKVSVISVESKIDSIKAPDTELGSLLSATDFDTYLHRLKGTDDSLIILISNAINQKCTRYATVMSNDGNMIRDFKADYTYTCPFFTKIHVNNKLQSEFVVNFTNDDNNYLGLIKSQIINNPLVTDNNGLFTRVNKPLDSDINKYYYSLSTQPVTGNGFDVKNWYSRSESNTGMPVINAIFNEPKPSDAFRSIPYIDTKTRLYKPVLNPSGKPYLSQDGTIAKLKNHPTIPYLTETWDDATQTYIYVPAQDNNRNYYTDSAGKIDTIEIFDWQPYSKKYVSTNNSSGEHVEYYQKYMKYKAKYNELKEKLGL